MAPDVDPDALLEDLDPEQREVALHLSGPVQVVAGAGTGKTRAITTRIAYGVATGTYDPSSVLALTFTTRAAEEMRGRLGTMAAGGVAARTFHAAALRQVRHFYPRVMSRDVPDLMSDITGLLAETVRRVGAAVDSRDLANEIAWAKGSNVAPGNYEERAGLVGRRVQRADPAEVARLYGEYEKTKAASQVWDMHDVLLAAVGLLTEHPDVAERVRGAYRTLLVDEFQDVSPVQVRLLRLWLGRRSDLCVVGDPDQTIYTFAGADPGFLTGLGSILVDPVQIRLWRNYRSTPQVVTAARRVIDAGSGTPRELVAQREAGDDVDLVGFGDERLQARGVARRVADHVRGGAPLAAVAVLLRQHSQAAPIVEELRAAGVGVTSQGPGRGPRQGTDEPPRGSTASSGVTVTTVHAAKGKEWPFVVLAGMNEGTWPTRAALRAGVGGGVDEERRLCYVGMTRARDRLLMTYVDSPDGPKPSRFLEPLLAARRRRVRPG